MFIECPHCYRRVGIGSDALCPNCRRDTRDLSGIDPNKSTLVIPVASVMPDVCCDCGLTTTRLATIVSHGARNVESSGGDEPGAVAMLLSVVLLFLSPISYVFGQKDSPRTRRLSLKLRLKVPQCLSCSAHDVLPITVDHERRWMKLLVHNEFKERYAECNAVPV